MNLISQILIVLLAVLHLYILVLEMFLWTTARARNAFGTTLEFAEATRILAGNQGLYNGFLAVGFVWGLWSGRWDVKMFFSLCVVVAGLYGGLTTNRRILLVQALPGALAVVALLLTGPR